MPHQPVNFTSRPRGLVVRSNLINSGRTAGKAEWVQELVRFASLVVTVSLYSGAPPISASFNLKENHNVVV